MNRTRALRHLAATLVAATALSPVFGAVASAAEKLPEPIPVESMSRSEVAAVCNGEGDVAYGTSASSGDYGCLHNDGETVHCTGGGDCTWTPAGRLTPLPDLGGTKGGGKGGTTAGGKGGTRLPAVEGRLQASPPLVLSALRSLGSSATSSASSSS